MSTLKTENWKFFIKRVFEARELEKVKKEVHNIELSQLMVLVLYWYATNTHGLKNPINFKRIFLEYFNSDSTCSESHLEAF